MSQLSDFLKGQDFVPTEDWLKIANLLRLGFLPLEQYQRAKDLEVAQELSTEIIASISQYSQKPITLESIDWVTRFYQKVTEFQIQLKLTMMRLQDLQKARDKSDSASNSSKAAKDRETTRERKSPTDQPTKKSTPLTFAEKSIRNLIKTLNGAPLDTVKLVAMQSFSIDESEWNSTLESLRKKGIVK